MASSRERVVNDNIHGDIPLRDEEWRVVNTATFQRLRSLKQLGMAHLVYPNATHTRFAHSLGVFRIMCRVLNNLTDTKLTAEQQSELRLAALLHDLGHYPYSHLMERIDHVVLTEQEVVQSGVQAISGADDQYRDHEELGRHILERQKDIREAVGGKERAEKIGGALFSPRLNQPAVEQASPQQPRHGSVGLPLARCSRDWCALRRDRPRLPTQQDPR